jgi:hypothetical protein
MDRTPWHPAAVQAFGNELDDWKKDLTIEAEHQLRVRQSWLARLGKTG